EYAGPFTLMISKTPGFEKFLKTEGINQNHVSVRLTDASLYYWKVLWTDPEKPEHVESSATWTMKYKIPDGLPGPVLVEPIRDGLVKTVNPQPVEFTWKAVEKAVKYRIVLERFDETTQSLAPVFDKTVSELTVVSAPLVEGDYQWRVHSVDEKDAQGPPSESRKLKVKAPDILMAPKLKPLEIK
ncbi:MAG: hypothetical protein ABL958_11975, partial [Bdellovibrionia bacterium]